MKLWHLITFGAICFVAWFHLTGDWKDLGIITVEGYEHATYNCGDSIIIDPGHEHDDELEELYILAENHCPKD